MPRPRSERKHAMPHTIALDVLSRPDIWHHVADWLELRDRANCWLVCRGLREAGEADGFDYVMSNLCVRLAGVDGPCLLVESPEGPEQDSLRKQIWEFASSVQDWQIEAEGWMYCALLQGEGSWMYRGAAKTRIARHAPYTERAGGWRALEALCAALRGDVAALTDYADHAPRTLLAPRDTYRMSLAHNAAWNGHVECLSLLLDREPSFAADCAPGPSMLHVMASRGHHRGLAELVRTYDLDPNILCGNRRAPIHFAIAEGRTECLAALIEAGADPEFAPMHERQTPLLYACAVCRPACVRALVERHGADLDATDARRRGGLHQVCHYGGVECLDVLLGAWGGRSLCGADWVGNTPLHYAADYGFAAGVARILDRAGADPVDAEVLLQCANMHGMTPLHIACKQGYDDLVHLMLSRGASCRAVDARGYTPLHWAARSGHEGCIRGIVGSGGDYDANAVAVQDLGSTPLHCAVRYGAHSTWGHLGIAALAMVPETDLHARDAHGLTALHMAVVHRAHTIADLLLGLGTDINARIGDDDRATPLHVASLANWTDGVRLLIDHGADVDARDGRGCTPLMCCVYRSSAVLAAHDCAAALLAAGADPELADTAKQRTAMHWGAMEGARKYIETLVAFGAEVNARDTDSATPLHYAAAGRSVDTVVALLDSGADRQAVDARNRRPVDVSTFESIRLLLEHGG